MKKDSAPTPVVAGVDTHKDTHYAAVITTTGQHLEAAQFPTTAAGYRALTAFVTSFGDLTAIGVEGTNSYGAGLARHLTGAGFDVLEVLQPKRQVRRMHGKSDEIDAYAAAEAALAGVQCSTAKSADGLVEAMRAVTIARNSAVKAHSEAIAQIKSVLISAPDPLRCQFRTMTNTALLRALAKTRTHTSDDRVAATTRSVLRALAQRVMGLETEISAHDQALQDLVIKTNPALLQAKGIGVISAARLLLTCGDNPERIKTEGALAMMCGAAPIPASSGKTTRHRLNRGGDRQANHALHDIAIVRLHTDPRTRQYAKRKEAEGKTKKDILRCLKRAIAREVYHLITNPPAAIDAAALKVLRHENGMTLQDVADDLGCSIQKISYHERGRTQDREFLTTYRDYLTTRGTRLNAA